MKTLAFSTVLASLIIAAAILGTSKLNTPRYSMSTTEAAAYILDRFTGEVCFQFMGKNQICGKRPQAVGGKLGPLEPLPRPEQSQE